jgi:transposase
VESKKRSLGAGERDEFLRAAWRLLVAGKVDAERLVFLDEMGTNVSLCPLYAWSPKGQRAFGSAPRNWGKNVTLLASITREGLGPCLAVEGSTTREVFETYLEHVLALTLKPGQIVVMDNLSAHKGGRVKEIIEARGCELLYLPPYSPDFNPIEQAFSKIKGLLRRVEARTREALIEAMGRALDAVTVRDVLGSSRTAATARQGPTAMTGALVACGCNGVYTPLPEYPQLLSAAIRKRVAAELPSL